MYDKILALLKLCLIPQSIPSKVITNIDWTEVLAFAQAHAIVGLFWKEIQNLPPTIKNKPSYKDITNWAIAYKQIEKRNFYLYQKSAWVCSNFKKEGFEACILKGQGNAILYPDIYERSPGDIDVWLRPANKETRKTTTKERRQIIIQYVKQIIPEAPIRFHHIQFDIIKGLSIELHFFPINLNNPFANKKLQCWFHEMEDFQFSHTVKLHNNSVICIPTLKFNLVYQMCHILHHFFDDGIGLRQLIDYYYLLKQEPNEETKEEIRRMFSTLHIEQFANAVMFVLHNTLGLECKYLLCPPDKIRGSILQQEILRGGNFGKNYRFNHSTTGKKYFAKIKRNITLVNLCPSEAIWEPWFRTWHFFWRLFNY
ncbi:nucleotidyltransferase family protein [Prevotella sp. A2931]|uniref:Nucleotidyltransferase family protein n=1 Tax=Prevotella illustrans TaxID=2800387 RepID=A0ABS3M3X6_9BACT|nr:MULTISPECIES: nucleotidyltransferase family protein [Prevotella]MBO1362882.1 nucleotidyltransferase family protein [Prevotella illustrans]PTL25946.1 hypothetical protein C3V39_01990 [Prevotella sp. oral taxon 820]